MKLYRFVVVSYLSFPFLLSAAEAQDALRPRHLVHDWSNHHVVFTGLTAENAAAAAEADPRAWQSWVALAHHGFTPREPDTERDSESHPSQFRIPKGRRHHMALETDWQMPIGVQVGPTVFPAKFSFDVNAAPDCANDYVVFPTLNGSSPGLSGGPASVVAFNNLYTGPGPTGICPTPSSPASQPSLLFAYNTATITNGMAYLSPVLSLDGKKIAFVEGNNGSGNSYAAFHVLTWKAGEGTAWNSAATPGDCSAGNSCMTTLVLNNAFTDSTSSPFMDYAHGTVYVGDDSGRLHKITPVFNGTPVEVTGNGWPVQLQAGSDRVHSPVYDSGSSRVFVTDNSGSFYVVDATSGAVLNTAASLGLFNISDPIVDSSDQTVFLFGPDLTVNLSVWQFDTSGTLLRKISPGALAGTANVYVGAFDNNYFTSPSSGLLYFAGSVSGHATLFAAGFTGTTMNASFFGPLLLSTSSTTSEATGLTEIFNPSFSTAKDRLFLGIEFNCTNGSANGCIESFDISSGFPSGILDSRALATAGSILSVSGIVIDNISSSAQGSSIYFESFTPQQSAIKLTQSGLN